MKFLLALSLILVTFNALAQDFEEKRFDVSANGPDIFAEFDTHAVAAASLGQVHRARLKSGKEVAVKVQYPGMARSIRSDLRNLMALMLPLRLGKAWKNLRQQVEEIRHVLEAETDYEQEARNLRLARSQFGEDDMIVVPKVHDDYCTRRVLTMDWIEGEDFDQFLAAAPEQSRRDRFGELIPRAAARLYYSTRTLYADPHPGNFIFMPDGRLGLIDFGCMRTFNDAEWEYLRQADMAMGGDREAIMGHLRRGIDLTDKELADEKFIDLAIQWCEWVWEPTVTNQVFDYGDPDWYRRGIDLMVQLSRRSRPQNKPVNLFIMRWHLANHAVLYRLKARVNMHAVTAPERIATGWGPRPGERQTNE